MPNGHSPREYGEHKYADHDGTSDCEFGCGCWMGPSRSGGPTGVDPFGTCPNNPKDGQRLDGKQDYDNVVTERIQSLETRAYRAEERLKAVKPGKAKLVEELKAVRAELVEKDRLLNSLRQLLGTG